MKTSSTRYVYLNRPFQPRPIRDRVDILNVIVVTLYCVTVLACVAGTICVLMNR